MGFLKALISGEILLPDHRVVGRMAKDFCIGTSVSSKEVDLLNNLHLDEERFIYARNALLVKIFNLFFQSYSEKTKVNPNSRVNLAMTFFYERVIEYWASVPELEKEKMENLGVAINYAADLASSPERLYVAASGKTFDSLLPIQQAELEGVVTGYIEDVADFFKKHLPKLLARQ